MGSARVIKETRNQFFFLCFMLISTVGVLVSSSGCTLVENCSLKHREYCIDGDCFCGDPCTRQSVCENADDVCAAYEYTPLHGVCVDASYARRHNLYSLGNVAGAGCTDSSHCRSGVCYIPDEEDEGFCTQDCGSDYTCYYGGDCSDDTYVIPGTEESVHICLDHCGTDDDCHSLTTCDRLVGLCVPIDG